MKGEIVGTLAHPTCAAAYLGVLQVTALRRSNLGEAYLKEGRT
jgi:hypothetical protein